MQNRLLLRMARFPLMYRVPLRTFATNKYKFDIKEYDPNRFEVSQITHKSNAEQLINKLPIVEVEGNTVRCVGV